MPFIACVESCDAVTFGGKRDWSNAFSYVDWDGYEAEEDDLDVLCLFCKLFLYRL